jgi:hypothetical protein
MFREVGSPFLELGYPMAPNVVSHSKCYITVTKKLGDCRCNSVISVAEPSKRMLSINVTYIKLNVSGDNIIGHLPFSFKKVHNTGGQEKAMPCTGAGANAGHV